MAETVFKAKLRWELRKTILHIHVNAVVFTTTLIRWLKGTTIGWYRESDQLEASIAQTAEATTGPVDDAMGIAGVASLLIALADHLLWDLNETIDDVAQSPTELPSRRVGRPWRCLNIGEYGAAEDCEGTSNN